MKTSLWHTAASHHNMLVVYGYLDRDEGYPKARRYAMPFDAKEDHEKS